MQLEYRLADPTKNITLLVTSPCDVQSCTRIAADLMALEPAAEQLGFLSDGDDGADICLRMSGGEFCGNATMSAGAYVCMMRGLDMLDCRVRVYGTKDPVKVSVIKNGNDYSCKVEMPRPTRMRRQSFTVDGEEHEFDIVCFSGITHLISTGTLTRDQAENNIRTWCRELGCEALGIMLVDPDCRGIKPLVYVAGVDSLFWESSCASGTTAVGMYLSESGENKACFSEPGGELRFELMPDGTPVLGGKVSFGEVKTAQLPDISY